ncbi:MAG: PD-(D/E)XK nuclease family protein [Candidatus Hodarchaeota archaeon]
MNNSGRPKINRGIENWGNDLKEIKEYLSRARKGDQVSDINLSRCLNETWFSSTLAWLLDPKGSHGFGLRFAQRFVQEVGRIRSKGKRKYAHRKSHLKWGKSGPGTGATSFSFKNAAVFREYYLTKEIKKRSGRGPRYCDVVFMDLDSKDNIFLVIENKFFTTNHPNQLEEYYAAVEKKYERAKIREYVYLTMRGTDPEHFGNRHSPVLKHWVSMSWTGDILPILENLNSNRKHKEVKKLTQLLGWLKHMLAPANRVKKSVDTVMDLLVEGAAYCLLDELQRLGEGKRGDWGLKVSKGKSTRLVHSSVSAPLYVELLPNASIAVQGRSRNNAQFDKILVPYGSHPDQIFNLLDIAARDIYHYHFNDYRIYKADKRKRSVTKSETRGKYSDLFKFVHKRRHELQVLFLLSSRIWTAEKVAIKQEYVLSE